MEITIYMNSPSIFQQNLSQKKIRNQKLLWWDWTKCILYAHHTFIEPFLFIFGTFPAIRIVKPIGSERVKNFRKIGHICSDCVSVPKAIELETSSEMNIYIFRLNLGWHNSKTCHFWSHSYWIVGCVCMQPSNDGQKVQVNLIVWFKQYVRNANERKRTT